MLVKWNPYTDIERTVDSLFRRPFALRPFWDDRNGESVGWQPAVNVFEDKEKLSIEAQLPGIDLKDVSLTVIDHTLQIRGERKVEHDEERDGYHFREAQYGTFSRSFSLPSSVDAEKVKASYERGVLTVSVPKQEKAKPRTVQIEAK